MLKTADIRIRDPYVLCENGKYYLYASNCIGANTISSNKLQLNMVVYESMDLENWENPKTVFSYEPTENSWIQQDLWAPEVHKYNGKFYAFMSFKSDSIIRGTFIAQSNTPNGMFTLLSDRPQTPEYMSCIDGTLYVEDDKPYIVFSRDWIANYVENMDWYMGEIWAAELSKDLSQRVGEPFKLFSSNESPLSSKAPNVLSFEGKTYLRYGSDAPYIIRGNDGQLFITWSPMLDQTYVVLTAVSENGKIKGKWKHSETPLFCENGGHAMFFNDLKGKRKVCLHCPEIHGQERALILDIEEQNGNLVVKK